MNNNNGLSKTRLYTIFSGMKQRCYNPKTKHFNRYGGRGITTAGGNHDILFLLKSLDLDIRLGYKLGTVCGYGRSDLFDQ